MARKFALSPPHGCPLLELSAELRNRIWEMCLFETEPINISIVRPVDKAGRYGVLREPGLLRACAGMRNEALAMYYGNTTFMYSTISNKYSNAEALGFLAKLFQEMGPQKTTLLKEIRVQFDYFADAFDTFLYSWAELVATLPCLREGVLRPVHVQRRTFVRSEATRYERSERKQDRERRELLRAVESCPRNKNSRCYELLFSTLETAVRHAADQKTLDQQNAGAMLTTVKLQVEKKLRSRLEEAQGRDSSWLLREHLIRVKSWLVGFGETVGERRKQRAALNGIRD